MLPPFRIKGIVGHPLHRRRRSRNDAELGSDIASTQDPDNQHSAEFEVQGDGVVQVSAKEYDQTIKELPAARLQYQDDDDGEIVVVGSSLELSQLIGELLPSSYRLPLSALNSEHSPTMHTFEIQETIPVIDVWQNFRLRTVSNSIYGQPSCQPIRPNGGHRQITSCRSINAPPEPTSTADHSNTTRPESDTRDVSSGQHDDHLSTLENMVDKKCNPSVTDSSTNKCTRPTDGTPKSLFEASSSGGNDFITEEGKKQAHAAGRQLRDARKLYWPDAYWLEPAENSSACNSGDFWRTYEPAQQFFEPSPNPREREPESPESPIETSSKPLLSQFEAELSRLMAQNAGWESLPPTTAEPTIVVGKGSGAGSHSAEVQEPKSDSREDFAANSTADQAPDTAETISHIVTVFGKSFQSLLSRVNLLTTELTARLPEIEQRMRDMQHHIPDQMHTTIHETLQAMGSHIQTLAGVMQHAATSARSSSTATNEAERVVTTQLNNLRTLASDIRDIGGSLIAGFEKGLKPQENTNISDPSLAPEAVNPATNNIFIGNLPPDATEESVVAALANQGFVGTVTLPKDSLTGDHAGFCYVRFPTTYAAVAALQALRGTFIGEHCINVEPTSESLHPEPDNTVEPSDGPIVHPTSGLLCGTTEAEMANPEVPVSELDNNTDNVVHPQQHLATTSQCASVTLPVSEGLVNTQPPPNTALLDESEANLAERYPSLLASQGANSLGPNAQHDIHIDFPFGPNDINSGISRYPSMQQLELQHLLTHNPQPVSDWEATRTRPTHGCSEQNTNRFSSREPLAPPVPDRIPGSWPWDQETQQSSIPSRPHRNESQAGPSTSGSMNHFNRPILSDLSHPFNPLPRHFPPIPSNSSSLRRSATERVHRSPPRPFEFHPYPRRRSSTHELAEISTGRDHQHSDLPGTFPRESQAATIAETPLNDKTELCLSHLRALGFGNDRSQDENRLRIFAEAADGNLEEAIEMIEEERKAYEQGPVSM
ncbi:hypothetical protein MferCBS31731_006423 [Microsporum ferrugineum]